ncbi:MAG: ATP-dependent DNA helicase RecG [Lachnospiraceae bacterium]|nr:ATP-dependent DNA helicase RecG [Lachnospiraceae bacterium]
MLITDGIEKLKGIGEKTAPAFHAAGIFSIADLLYHYPRSYEKLGEICPMGSIKKDGRYTLAGKVLSPASVFYKNGKSILQFSFGDDSGKGRVSLFGMPYLKKNFEPGRRLILQVYAKRKGEQLFLSQPRILKEAEYEEGIRQLKAVYPLSGKLSQTLLRKAVAQALPLAEELTDCLNEERRRKLELPSIAEAMHLLHAPADTEQAERGRRRLAFDEFFLFLAAMELLKDGPDRLPSPYVISEGQEAVRPFIEGLAYELTPAQKRSLNEVLSDMAGGYVMNRLLQGDVGSGKTVIAFAAALAAIRAGHQAAIMAPTEVLARQHHAAALRYSESLGKDFVPELLVGSMTAKEKREARARIAAGEAKLVIGTHALIQDGVEIPDAALIVTDEQHRFGVRQRRRLAGMGAGPHVLVMSATPIPRTLGLILYGDMDVSLIDELPAERLPIKNAIVDESWREKLLQFIVKHVREGQQCYIICPQVEEGEDGDIRNVTDYTEELRESLPDDIRIGMLHGRMKPEEKSSVMEEFASAALDILVSTTVVEVGVNVPNATVMVIENAERFGLSQLHQLRGRVGRGDKQSYCVFVAGGDDGELSKKAKERLEILKKSNNGFEIAEEDLKQRGPGEFFGSRQSGVPYFELADIYGDSALLTAAKQTLMQLIKEDPGKLEPLRQVLKERNKENSTEFRGICL